MAPELNYRAKIRLLEQDKEQMISIRSSKTVPQNGAPDHELFLAMIYPGITSDPGGSTHVHHPRLNAEGKPEALPGMGLANLVNGTVDVFGGTIAFRSGSYFMNVAPFTKSSAARYAVKIEQRWFFPGNMITVRIPLRKKTTL